jgi:AcrR family transcriptional regulator
VARKRIATEPDGAGHLVADVPTAPVLVGAQPRLSDSHSASGDEDRPGVESRDALTRGLERGPPPMVSREPTRYRDRWAKASVVTSHADRSGEVTVDPGICERRDAAVNRVRILKVARRLIERDGFAAITVSQVADEAGVGKGTIYRRFGDWAGVTIALLDESIGELREAVVSGPPPLGPGAPPEDRLAAFLAAYLAWLDAHLEVALAAEMAAPIRINIISGSFTPHIRALIRRLMPANDDLALATLLLGAVDPSAVPRLREADVSLDEQQAAAHAFLAGLTRSGCR